MSRILAKIIASGLQEWSEKHGALDEIQDGFLRHRSNADTTQVMVRLQEANRRLKVTGCIQKHHAGQVDLTKAYASISYCSGTI